MPTSPMTSVIEQLRRAVLLRDGAHLGDGELLGGFIERRDEAALAGLIKRHGPMVWGVCRRLLSHHDAEDAFQATFLVLVRKAASIVPREMVGNWLYGVAYQTALQARRTAARRRAREVQVTQMPDTADVQQDQWADVQPLLDQELNLLPGNYRAVIVLCDLEERTRKEVARQLGVPEGTVAGRLARARTMLAKRLAQRGVTLSGGTLAAVLAQNSASVGVPRSVVSATISAANFFAAGQAAAAGAISPQVAALTDGVLKAMLISKLKAVIAVVLVLGLMATGASVLTYRTAAAQGDKPPIASDKPKSGPVDPAAALVRQLGDPNFATRKAAGDKLRQLGVKARPALEAALRDPPDLETARRARELLTAVRSDHRAAFAKQFDPKKSEEYDHPVWKHYVAIAGDSRASRELFARIIANEKWLRTLDNAEADPAGAGHVYRVGIAEVFRDFDRDPDPSPQWPCNRVEEVAYLLLLGSHPDNNPPKKLVGAEIVPTNLRNTLFLGRGIICGEGQILHARGMYLGLEGNLLDTSKGINAPTVAGAAGTDRVFAKLLAAWVVRRDPSSEMFKRGKGLLAQQKPKAEPPDDPKPDPKPENKTEGFTAWGKEVGGLQAGLGYHPGQKRAYRHGETVKLTVRVRNVSKEEVKFKYLRQFFIETPPAVTDDKDKPVPLARVTAYGIHIPVDVKLAPGKEIELYELNLGLLAEDTIGSTGFPTLYGTGKFSVQYERVFGHSSSGPKLDPSPSKLATGKLELEVKSAPPAAPGK